MTNEEKSKIIAHDIRNKALGKYESAYQGAMAMAEFKDKLFEDILDASYEMRKDICRSNVSFADCTELIQKLRKQLK